MSSREENALFVFAFHQFLIIFDDGWFGKTVTHSGARWGGLSDFVPIHVCKLASMLHHKDNSHSIRGASILPGAMAQNCPL